MSSPSAGAERGGFAARYRARWIVPVSGPPVPNGALLVGDDGRITAVGPDAAVPAPPGAAHVELGDAALLPGLVNAHAHPELTLFRGHIEDRPFPSWIATLMRRKRALPDLDYSASARWGCVEAVAAGITTLAATEDSGAALDALLEAGLRGVVYREVFGPDPAVAEEAAAELRRRVEAMRRRANGRVAVGVSPHAPYTVSDALYRRVAEYAREEALPVAVHIAESAEETALVTRGGGPFAEGLRRRGIAVEARAASPVRLLERLGVLRTRPLLIHCVQVDEEDVGRVADAGAGVAHCPVANARLGHGVMPLCLLLDAGVAVGLGTDSVASNNRQDLLEEARTAQIIQRATLREPAILDAASVLRLATLGGARALGLDATIGSLEPGKAADLCAVALDRPHTVPVHDPIAAIVHSTRATDVVLTVVGGRTLFRDGDFPEIDEGEIRTAVIREAARVEAAASANPASAGSRRT